MDSGNMVSVLREFPKMMKEAKALGDGITLHKQFIENIVVTGMGGSGYNGDILSCYLNELEIPVFVIKDYKLPKYVTKKSFMFAMSYSGNTEEPIAAYRTAIRRGINVISVSSGGKLAELASMNKNPHIMLPKGIQPRLSTPYQFVALLNVLAQSGIIEDQESALNECIKDMANTAKTVEQGAEDLAKKLKGAVPIIYSSSSMYCLAEKWKTDINENSKTEAFYNVFPEFNHNELCAYEHPLGKYHVVIISDSKDYERIKKRIDVFKRTIKEYGIPVTELAIKGTNRMSRLFSGIWMGLFVAYYLALAYGIDPTPVRIIEKFKKELK